MTYTYLIKFVLLSSILIFYAQCQSADSSHPQTQSFNTNLFRLYIR
jgi:hypothetical protein